MVTPSDGFKIIQFVNVESLVSRICARAAVPGFLLSY